MPIHGGKLAAVKRGGGGGEKKEEANKREATKWATMLELKKKKRQRKGERGEYNFPKKKGIRGYSCAALSLPFPLLARDLANSQGCQPSTQYPFPHFAIIGYDYFFIFCLNPRSNYSWNIESYSYFCALLSRHKIYIFMYFCIYVATYIMPFFVVVAFIHCC